MHELAFTGLHVYPPALVEAALHRVVQVLRPHSLEGAKSIGGFHVTHNTHNNHGRGLDQGNSLAHLLLVHLCIQFTPRSYIIQTCGSLLQYN